MLGEAAAPALPPLSPLPQEPIPSPRPPEAFSFFPTSPACAVAGSFGFFPRSACLARGTSALVCALGSRLSPHLPLLT